MPFSNSIAKLSRGIFGQITVSLSSEGVYCVLLRHEYTSALSKYVEAFTLLCLSLFLCHDETLT